MTHDDCPMCVRLAGDAVPGEVWRFARSVAYLGEWQFYQGYCVLVSRAHAVELIDLPPTERREFLEEMCFLAEAIRREFSPRKLNHELLGNQVPHPHWHLFPRYTDDPERLKPVWEAIGRAAGDDGERARLLGDPGKFEETRSRLRRRLESMQAP